MNFLWLIILLLVVAFFLRIDFIFYIIYVCLGIYIWSRWIVSRPFRKILSERLFNKQAFWGEDVTVTVRLYNQSRFSLPWLQLQESVAVELAQQQSLNHVITVPRRGRSEFSYRVKANKRGYYRLGPMYLSTSDLFGFGQRQRAVMEASYLTIYPKIISLSKLGLQARLPFGTVSSRQRLFADPARPSGVRDYRSGDSLRQINWKVTAHTATNKLMVRTNQPAISLTTAVCLDLNSTTYEEHSRPLTVEWAIEVAASLAAYLSEQRQAVGLMTNGIDPLIDPEAQFDEASGRLLRRKTVTLTELIPPPIAPRNGRSHLIKILEQLARIEMAHTIPFRQWLPRATAHLGWGITLLVISPKGSEAICQRLHQLVRAGFNPVLLVVEPTPSFAEIRQRARYLGFPAHLVTHYQALKAWQNGTESSLTAR